MLAAGLVLVVASLPQLKAVKLRLSHVLSALEQSPRVHLSGGACFSTAEEGSKLKVLRGTKKGAGRIFR